MANIQPLSGRIALVTGGGGGIGAGICTALAEAGATILISYKTLDSSQGCSTHD